MRRKGKPYKPATPAAPVHDRQSTDLLRNARVAPMEVDDPLEPGARLIVARSLRDDPLARLHVRDQIDDAQYEAGRAYQEDFETAGRGPRAVDPSKEYVDGGRAPEPITEAQRGAARRLVIARRALGQDGHALTNDILLHGKTCAQIAADLGLRGESWEHYFGRRIRECLDRLSIVYGFANGLSEEERCPRAHR